MGLCISRDAAVTQPPKATAKLILQDGVLREFAWPVKASHAIQSDGPSFFVCDADGMDFDGALTAIDGDEDLQLGQIYFVLPRSMLKHPLPAEEMAALAVKASAALRKSRDPAGKDDQRRRRCRQKYVSPVALDEDSSGVSIILRSPEDRWKGARFLVGSLGDPGTKNDCLRPKVKKE